jgi:Double zinc ribbon
MSGGKVRATDASTTGCGHQNPSGYQFCDVCGTQLPLRCPHCGRQNREGAKFCGHCGAPLTGALPEAGVVVRFISLDQAGEREDTDDDARARIARLFDYGADVPQPRWRRFGLAASAITLLAVLSLFIAWLWMGPRAGGTRLAAKGTAKVVDQRDTEWPGSAERLGSAGSPGLGDSRGRAESPDARPSGPAEKADEEDLIAASVRSPGGGPAPLSALESTPTHQPAPVRKSGAEYRGGSVETMAEYLVATLGSERAEARALRNTEWYSPGSADFAYWQHVTAAIRTRTPAR